MILPIVAYGDPVLRKKASEIDKDYPGLDELINSMWETMYKASGVGLAAPQIGRSIRLFVINSSSLFDENEPDKFIKKVFINAQMLDEKGNPWNFEEGCLSIPKIREDVARKSRINIRYFDENFEMHESSFEGLNARVIQHEYDHIEGILFTDHLKPLKRRMLRSKLDAISKGKVDIDYKMQFPK